VATPRSAWIRLHLPLMQLLRMQDCCNLTIVWEAEQSAFFILQI
jgi:hypothetical protein